MNLLIIIPIMVAYCVSYNDFRSSYIHNDKFTQYYQFSIAGMIVMIIA